VIALIRYAWRSLARRPLIALLLALSLGIAFGLPGAVRAVADAFETELKQRADAAPLVLGASGNNSDLVLHALYFRGEPSGSVTVADKEKIDGQGIADTVPLCINATVHGIALVGTDGSYFKLRGLSLSSGKPIARLGDCVLGARAAERLGLATGGKVATDPKNLFGGNGGTPVRLTITGVLAPTGTADDDVAFVSLETAWLVLGLGHGHANPSKVHADDEVAANASGFIEVTDENAASFHFHGRRDRFPLTAVIVIPHSERDRVLMVARAAANRSGPALVETDRVIRDLLDVTMRVQRLFEASALVTATATMLLCAAVVALTLRLRWTEVRTMARLGIARHRIAMLLGIEFFLIGLASFAMAAMIVVAFRAAAPMMFRLLIG
jgi:putative ABC transport system permease protein